MAQPKNSICEEEVFDSFFKSHAKLLRNHLYYKFGDLDQAEDWVQETFIKLWNNCAKVSLDKAKGYIFTIANNLGIDSTRHQKVRFNYKNYINRSIGNV